MALPTFNPANAGWCLDANGRELRLTPYAQKWLLQMVERVGGANAPTNADFAVIEYADAGIEESKADIYRLQHDISTLQGEPSQSAAVAELHKRIDALEAAVMTDHELRAVVHALTSRLDALESGTTL